MFITSDFQRRTYGLCFRWRQIFVDSQPFLKFYIDCDWFKVFTPKCLYFRDRFLAQAKDCLTDHVFKKAVNIEVTVFPSSIYMHLQAAINVSFQVVLTRFTLVFSCIDICFQVVLTRLVFAFKLLFT